MVNDFPAVRVRIGRPPECQETIGMIGDEYVRCGAPAVAIIDNGDTHLYLMCGPCAAHNIGHRGAKPVMVKPGEERFVTF